MSEKKKTDTWHTIATTDKAVAGQVKRLAKIVGWIAGGALCIVAFVIFISVLRDLNSALSEPDHGAASSVRDLFAPLIALVGFPFIIWRSWILGKQARTAEAQKQLAEDRNFSDLFTKAVEQLGADKTVKRHATDKDGNLAYDDNGVPVMQETTEPNLPVRVGAIYALERIARASQKDHIAIMETLCTYVRSESPVSSAKEYNGVVPLPSIEWDSRRRTLNTWAAGLPKMREDIQAALTAIGRRSTSRINYEKTQKPSFFVDLSFTNLQRAVLDHALLPSARLRDSNLSGARFFRANLEGAILSDVDALETIFGSANLTHCFFTGGRFHGSQFIGARLFGSHFVNANVSGAVLASCNAVGAKFSGINGLDRMSLSSFFGAKNTDLSSEHEPYRPQEWSHLELDDEEEINRAHNAWAIAKNRKANGDRV